MVVMLTWTMTRMMPMVIASTCTMVVDACLRLQTINRDSLNISPMRR